MPNKITVNCDQSKHSDCYGYVAPLVYVTSEPCACGCHAEWNWRNYEAARATAKGN